MKKIITILVLLSFAGTTVFANSQPTVKADLFSDVAGSTLTDNEMEKTDGGFAAVVLAPAMATPAAGPIIVGACVVGTVYVAYRVGSHVYNASKNKHLPKSQVGPSGKAKIHKKKYPSKKRAKDGARNEGTTKPIHHKTPVRGRPHYHSNNNGEKGRLHHEY